MKTKHSALWLSALCVALLSVAACSPAVAEQPTGADLGPGIEIFSRVSVSHGASPWTLEDVQGPASLRLYRARVSEHWVLDPERRPDQRTRVRP